MNAPNFRSFHATTRAAYGAAALAIVSVPAFAQDDSWRWTVTPYVWATDVDVDVELDGREVVDETIPVADLAEDIDATFQGRIEAKNGAHGVLLDCFFVSMSDESNGLTLPAGAGTGDVDWNMDMAIVDIAATFDPEGDDEGFSFLYGARIFHQNVAVDASFTTSSGTTPQSYTAKDTFVDALVGVRYQHEFSDHWRLETQLDASTGGTDFTWSAFPSLSYAFDDERFAVVAGYRTMTIDFEEQGGLESEMTLSGPVLGFRISF